MAPPAITERLQPAMGSVKMPDGFSSVIAFALDPSINFWEKGVKPPGIDGGEPIDTSTMLNLQWHTASPRTLLKLDNVTSKVAYDPDVYNKILSHLINVNGSITVHIADGTTISFFGWLGKFEPDDLEEGKMPEATITIYISNFDDTHQLESGPVVAAAHGT